MKRWYVVQVYAGYEEAAKSDILKRIQEQGLQEAFGEILIPSAKLKQFIESPESQDTQLFPGYILVEMELLPETMKLILSSLRVIKFLGGKDPMPLPKREIERVLSQMRGEVVVAQRKSDFVVGSEVEIKEGPFAGFVGIIESVDEQSERLTVMVSIFGRMTPVELGFGQIKQ